MLREIGRLFLLAILGGTAVVATRAQEAGVSAEPSLTDRLEELVDLETASARRKAAAALAREVGRDLEGLLAALEAFGRFEEPTRGRQVHTVELRVGKKTEATELVLWVPQGYDPAVPAPLLMSFHGTGGSGDHALPIWRSVADQLGMLVLAPSEAGENDGYHFSERERDSALAALRWMRRRFNVEEDRVFLTGVSRGGHLAWDLALRFPDRFAGLAPMIGGPRLATQNAQNNLRYLENVAQLSIRDLQGARDDPGLVFNVELAFEQLARLAARDARLFLQEEHGHSFDLKAVDWAEFFGSARRDPDPARVVRRAAREDEARAFWVEIEAFERGVDETFRPRVEQARWTAMDDGQRRRYLAAEAEARTARLEVVRSEPGRFLARGEGVRRFRLLLARGAFDAGEPVEVEFEGKTRRLRTRASAEVLLVEFAERFDRRYLPVAELEVR